VGFIYEDDLAEKELKKGDVYLIPAGSAFYLLNTGEDQKLQIICSIDPSERLGLGVYQVIHICI
jgi:mannose-6-phosphate isomerase-like protein (cupin superfamily)